MGIFVHVNKTTRPRFIRSFLSTKFKTSEGSLQVLKRKKMTFLLLFDKNRDDTVYDLLVK